MPPESVYIGTLVVDRSAKTYKIQSATVTGVQPNPTMK